MYTGGVCEVCTLVQFCTLHGGVWSVYSGGVCRVVECVHWWSAYTGGFIVVKVTGPPSNQFQLASLCGDQHNIQCVLCF